jgi:hypothetical protein
MFTLLFSILFTTGTKNAKVSFPAGSGVALNSSESSIAYEMGTTWRCNGSLPDLD